MVWFLRVLELADGTWACRRGSIAVDEHLDLADAVAHMYQLAQLNAPAQVYLHRLDGSTELLPQE